MNEVVQELIIRAPFAGVLIYVIWAFVKVALERNRQEHERQLALIAKLPGGGEDSGERRSTE